MSIRYIIIGHEISKPFNISGHISLVVKVD